VKKKQFQVYLFVVIMFALFLVNCFVESVTFGNVERVTFLLVFSVVRGIVNCNYYNFIKLDCFLSIHSKIKGSLNTCNYTYNTSSDNKEIIFELLKVTNLNPIYENWVKKFWYKISFIVIRAFNDNATFFNSFFIWNWFSSAFRWGDLKISKIFAWILTDFWFHILHY